MSNPNSLTQRIRDGLLFDAYGSLLTEKQQSACEMILIQDLSLSEAASSLGVSRQGVHDLLTRSREHMESIEASLGLIEKEARLEEIRELADTNRASLPKGFYEKIEAILKGNINV